MIVETNNTKQSKRPYTALLKGYETRCVSYQSGNRQHSEIRAAPSGPDSFHWPAMGCFVRNAARFVSLLKSYVWP